MQMDVDPDCRYAVFVSFVEIYNEAAYDLLEAADKKGVQLLHASGTLIGIPGWSVSSQKKRVAPKQLAGPDGRGNMYVRDTTEVEVRNIQDALRVLSIGHANRQVASTVLNHTSSRSHAVFSIKVRLFICVLDLHIMLAASWYVPRLMPEAPACCATSTTRPTSARCNAVNRSHSLD